MASRASRVLFNLITVTKMSYNIAGKAIKVSRGEIGTNGRTSTCKFGRGRKGRKGKRSVVRWGWLRGSFNAAGVSLLRGAC